MFYMFFWFFKQFYYCLRRIFKSGILLLILFFIAFLFIFIKPSYAFDFNYNGDTITVPDIPFDTTAHPSYMITYNTGDSIYQLAYPQTEPFIRFFKNGDGISYNYNNENTFGHWCYYNYNPRGNATTWGTMKTTSGVQMQYASMRYSTVDIYSNKSGGTIYFEKSTSTDPYITNDSTDIVDWSFDYLYINAGAYTSDSSAWLDFTYPDSSTTYDLDITDYYINISGTNYWRIPRSVITEDIVIRSGSTISFSLLVRENLQVLYYDLDSYTLNITSQQQTEINEDSNKLLLSDIKSEQEKTTEAIENLTTEQENTTNAINDLNNTITDDTVDDSSIYLPSDNSNDITADGLNGIFTSIYNAFCTGNTQDIVFPIPFTNKNITLQANYVRSMLTNSGATWVITIIEAFWWYLISRFIIKDITNKITKIKSGDIEDIEKSNIKGDML